MKAHAQRIEAPGGMPRKAADSGPRSVAPTLLAPFFAFMELWIGRRVPVIAYSHVHRVGLILVSPVGAGAA